MVLTNYFLMLAHSFVKSVITVIWCLHIIKTVQSRPSMAVNFPLKFIEQFFLTHEEILNLINYIFFKYNVWFFFNRLIRSSQLKFKKKIIWKEKSSSCKPTKSQPCISVLMVSISYTTNIHQQLAHCTDSVSTCKAALYYIYTLIMNVLQTPKLILYQIKCKYLIHYEILTTVNLFLIFKL